MNNVRLKYLVSERIATGASESANEYSSNETRYIRISDFDEKGNIREDVKVSIKNEKAANYLLRENDVLIAVTGGTVGKSMIFNLSEKSAYAGYLARIRTNEKLNYKYLWYYLNSPLFQKWRKEAINVSTIENISAGKYADLPIVYHEVNYQEKIVKELDTKFSILDKLIINQQQQIEKLKKYKQSLISEVVTKGLDPNAEMKESGIKWIGNIPSNIELVQLKRLATIYNGKEIKNTDGEIPVYGSGGIFKYTDDYLFDGESILYGRKGTIDKPLHVNGKFWTVDTMFYTDTNDLVLPRYLYYSSIGAINFEYYKSGSVLPSMTQFELGNVLLPLFDIETQKKLVRYLDQRISIIQILIEQKDTKINKLEEYKKSLIYEYVTGKKEVS